MKVLQIVEPEATVNEVTNPIFGIDTTGWTAVGSAITRQNTYARFGNASGRIVTNNAAANEGVYFQINPNASQEVYTWSLYIRGEGRVRIRLNDATNGLSWESETITLSNTRWRRLTVTGIVGAACISLRGYIETDGQQNITFYIDGAQLENKVYMTTFCSGNEIDCEWNTVEHASDSSRFGEGMVGGRYRDLDSKDVKAYPVEATGFGIPALRHFLVNRSMLPGMEYQGSHIAKRLLWLKCHVKNPLDQSALECDELPSLNVLHQHREQMIGLVAPPESVSPRTLRYQSDDLSVEIPFYYEAGLEFQGDLRDPYYNNFVMRLLAPFPFFAEDNQEVATLDAYTLIANAQWLARREDGQWLEFGTGPNAYVTSLAVGPDGKVYIGGNFTSIDGTTVNYIAMWDGTNINALGAVGHAPFGPGLNGRVEEIAIAPNGDVYIGGSFTDVNGNPGVNIDYITRYDPVTDTFNQVQAGVGLDNSVGAIMIAPNGDIYAGGAFHNGDGTALNHIGRWDGAAWNQLGVGANPGLNDTVSAIAWGSTGEVFIGGSFDDIDGGPVDTYRGIIEYDPVNDAWSALGTGLEWLGVAGFCYALEVAKDGSLYVGGRYYYANGVETNGISRWNGSTFYDLGSGSSVALIRSIKEGPDGNIYAAGLNGDLGDLTAIALGFWNGTEWNRMDVGFGFDVEVNDIAFHNNDLFVAATDHGFPGNPTTGGITTIDNPGSANSYPIITIEGPDPGTGWLVWLENQSTGARLYFNEFYIRDGEVITIDLRPSELIIKGNNGRVLTDQPRRTSDLASWYLQPGENKIAVYGSSNIDVYIRWRPLHWGFDGVSR